MNGKNTPLGDEEKLRKQPHERTIRIPYWVWESGIFMQRKGGSIYLVFSCLQKYANWTTGNGRIGRRRIEHETGLCRDTIGEACTFLAKCGLVKFWWRNTDRGFIRYYQVALSIDMLRKNSVTYLQKGVRRDASRCVSEKPPHKGAEKFRQRTSVSRTIKDPDLKVRAKREETMSQTLSQLLAPDRTYRSPEGATRKRSARR